MKAGLTFALVLCVAAAAFFAPVTAEKEDAAIQVDRDERLSGETAEPLRHLEGVEEDAVEATGTELEQDPADGMPRALRTYHRYYKCRYYDGYYYGNCYYYSYKRNPYYYKGHYYKYYGTAPCGDKTYYKYCYY